MLLIIAVILAVFLGYKITQEIEKNELHLYENFNDKKELISQSEYIKDSNHKFIICASRDGKAPCKEIQGLQHGLTKWYKNGVLEYQDIFNRGRLEKSMLLYSNGLRNHEIVFRNGVILRENFFADNPSNEITESIIYKDNETIKKFYKNGKVSREERYRNDKLVSRKFYNADGVMERLEEYGGFGSDSPFDDFMEDFEMFEKDFEFEQPMQNDKSGVWI